MCERGRQSSQGVSDRSLILQKTTAIMTEVSGQLWSHFDPHFEARVSVLAGKHESVFVRDAAGCQAGNGIDPE